MKISRTAEFNAWIKDLPHDEKGRISRKIQLVEKVAYQRDQTTAITRDVRHIKETDLSAIPTGDISKGGKGHWVVFSLREDEAIFLGGLDDINNRRAIDNLQAQLEAFKENNPRKIPSEEAALVSTGSGNSKGAELLEKWSGRGGGVRR